MKKITLLLLISMLALGAGAQDTAMSYSKVINAIGIKEDLYSKALTWCGQKFTDSKEAIKVQDKDAGLIAGKGYMRSIYKMPKANGDSALGIVFTNYYFDWKIEMKDNKARFQIENVALRETQGDFSVTSNDVPPIKILFQKAEKSKLEWHISKTYFFNRLVAMGLSLEKALQQKKDEW